MNDQQHPYDPYQPQPQIIGYDAYGQPVYQQQAQQPGHTYDPYAQQPQQPAAEQGYGYDYDPYAAGGGPQQQAYGYDAYGQQQGYGYPPAYDQTGQQAAVDTTQQWNVPPQQQYEQQAQAAAPAPVQAPEPPAQPQPSAVPGPRRPAPDEEPTYRTEQFSFIEEPNEDSEDVIDWLKFTESRSERREEARRRGRNRVVALIVVLALAVVGGVGYLWSAGMLPGTSDPEQRKNTATGPQKRDVIVVHLHNTKQGGTSTALLVDNTTTGQGTTVLLPNALAVANDDGTTTTLGKSVEDDGASGTREAIGTLLGTKITGTWRLDTPFLENLVEIVGNIDITTDTDVPAAKPGEDPLVKKGENQTLSGPAAVAYATHRGPGEPEAKQLQRFGAVMYGVLRKISSDPKSAAETVATLVQILDPSLPEKDLGASLAKLAEHAKGGDYKTAVLPVEPDGTLGEEATGSVVKDILGGKISAPEQGAAVRVGVRNATGNGDATEAARIVLVNGGYAFIDSGKADKEAKSQVIYGDAAQKPKADEVAKTLGLPAGTVQQGKAATNADVTVVLGQDYKIRRSGGQDGQAGD
ncbi:LCP family protein [Streptomyces purpureus]|uniref:LCP family protein n=1 Tax=Streptomyces purpureus TaxID=1951 RepID=UPI00036B4672|nr:LCP family protein [Streptomyces purpureus]